MIDLRDQKPPEPAEFRDSVSDSPESVLNAKQALDKAKSKVRELIDSGVFPKSDDFPRLWSDYKHLFVKAQHGGKCAYCETRFSAAHWGEVEHYRPRTEVREPRTRGNRDDTGREAPGRSRHEPSKPGYWWLAYCWNNLLCSCSRCNNWKSSSFPLRGKRGRMIPGAETDEDPLILNPYHEDPAHHLSFNQLGEVRGQTEKGRVTIDRCGLDRRSLVLERERIARQVIRDYEDYEVALVAENEMAEHQTLARLLGACSDSAPYAAMVRTIVAERVGEDS